MNYKFADFVLDTDRFELSRSDGALVTLQPRAMHLLILLVKNAGKLVTKHAITDEIWGGRTITDTAISSQVKALRKALGDTERPYRIIGTIHGEGLRLLADVNAGDGKAARPAATDPATIGTRQPGRAPRVAILSLRAMTSEPLTQRIAVGLPADIIAQLTHTQNVEVLARSTSFGFGQDVHSLGNVAVGVDLDYAVGGMLEDAGSGLRFSFELIEAGSHSVIWSDIFEVGHAELDQLRATVVAELVDKVGLHISANEARRALAKSPESLTAWDRFHLGMSAIVGRITPEYEAALDHFRAAVGLDDNFARAHAGFARCQIYRAYYGQKGDVSEALSAAVGAATRATRRDPLDSFANLVHSQALRMSRDLPGARELGEKALAIAPNYSDAHAMIAGLELYEGNFERSFHHGMRAIELDPRNPLGFENEIHTLYAATHLGDTETALDLARKLENNPVNAANPLALGAALTSFHHAGDQESARRVATKMRENPSLASHMSLDQVFGGAARESVKITIKALAEHLPERLA